MKVLRLLFIFLILSCIGCKKDPLQDPRCKEIPEPDGLCQMAFESWFYDAKTNSCQKIFYSGCSEKGFPTKKECEQCQSCKDQQGEYIIPSAIK